jgi:hypothetical protein
VDWQRAMDVLKKCLAFILTVIQYKKNELFGLLHPEEKATRSGKTTDTFYH